jgi:hypothetical protein
MAHGEGFLILFSLLALVVVTAVLVWWIWRP